MAKDKGKYTRNDDPARFVKSEYDPYDRMEHEPGGRLYEPLAALPSPSSPGKKKRRRKVKQAAPLPPASQAAPDHQPEDKAGLDSVKAEAADHPSAGQFPQESKEWVGHVVERRKNLGDIPGTITELSGQIHLEMKDAVRAGVVKGLIEPRTIETHLRLMGLFIKKKRNVSPGGVVTLRRGEYKET